MAKSDVADIESSLLLLASAKKLHNCGASGTGVSHGREPNLAVGRPNLTPLLALLDLPHSCRAPPCQGAGVEEDSCERATYVALAINSKKALMPADC